MKKLRSFSGFSLMEMMVVLLIVAVVMAAAAPMVSKKIAGSGTGSSCDAWPRLDPFGSIGYNLKGNDRITAMIGTHRLGHRNHITANKFPRLFIESSAADVPQIQLHDNTNTNFINFRYQGSTIDISNSSSTTLRNNAVALGIGAVVGGNSATAVGADAQAHGIGSIALGNRSYGGGDGAIGIGGSTRADGDYSIVLGAPNGGTESYAGAANSIAIGRGTQAGLSATNAIALGASSTASAANATALGADSTASAASATALGTNSNAIGANAIALGVDSSAAGTNSIAVGMNAKATSLGSIAIGSSRNTGWPTNMDIDCTADKDAVAIGRAARATGTNSTAIGTLSGAQASNAIAVGHSVSASKPDSIAIGSPLPNGGTSCTAGVNSIAIGRGAYSNGSTGSNSIAIGTNTYTEASNAIAIGMPDNSDSVNTNTAAAASAIAIGKSTKATQDSSIAIGPYSRAAGIGSIAIGTPYVQGGSISRTWAKKNSSVAIGRSAVAAEAQSIAIGYRAETRGEQAIAIGTPTSETTDNTFASTKSIAIGVNSQAKSGTGIAIGFWNVTEKPEGYFGTSIAIGRSASALHARSIAIGDTVQAKHIDSVAIGSGAMTSASNQIVLGTDKTTVYIPGTLMVGGDALLNTDLIKAATYIRSSHAGPSVSVYGRLTRDSSAIDAGASHQQIAGFPEHPEINLNVSDRRLKNVGEAFKGGLNELKKLEFFHYTFKEDKAKTPRVGVMAQDLQKVFPDAVIKGEDGFLRIRLEDMFYAVINAVKELDTRLTALTEQVKSNIDLTAKLQKQVNEQSEQIAELKKQNAEFEKRLAKLEKKTRKCAEE